MVNGTVRSDWNQMMGTTPHTPRARQSLQPVVPATVAEIAAFDTEPESRRLDELAADRAVLDYLMFRGYRGREWDEFCDVLLRYGITVIRAWARTGAIFDRCAVRQRPCCARQPITDHDEAESVAAEAVTAAWRYFEPNVIHARRWDPDKGASIKTFFIGACILFFARVYDRWYRHERQPDHVLPPLDAQPVADDAALPGRLYHQHQALEDILVTAEPKTAEIFRYLALEGLTYAEIAELCDTTVDAIKQRVARFRRQHPELQEQQSA